MTQFKGVFKDSIRTSEKLLEESRRKVFLNSEDAAKDSLRRSVNTFEAFIHTKYSNDFITEAICKPEKF